MLLKRDNKGRFESNSNVAKIPTTILEKRIRMIELIPSKIPHASRKTRDKCLKMIREWVKETYPFIK